MEPGDSEQVKQQDMPESEIKMDYGRGVATEKKKEELANLQTKCNLQPQCKYLRWLM